MPEVRIPIPITGESYKSISLLQSNQTCINWYPVSNQSKLKGFSDTILIPTPGSTLFSDDTTSKLAVRGAVSIDDELYIACDNKLAYVESDGTRTYMAGELDTDQGFMSGVANKTQVKFVDGVSGYVIDRTLKTWVKITDSDYDPEIVVDYKDGYGIGLAYDENQFQLSDLNDFTAYQASQKATVSEKAGRLMSLIVHKKELYVFTNEIVLIYYNTGASPFPFETNISTTIPVGCAASQSVCSSGQKVWFIGRDKTNKITAYEMSGYVYNEIATDFISDQLTNSVDISKVRAFCYSQLGRNFYVVQMYEDGKTFVYDETTKAWHERKSTGLSTFNQQMWYPTCYVSAFNKSIVGDNNTGDLYELDMDNHQERGKSILRERTTSVMRSEDSRRLLNMTLYLEAENGTGTYTGTEDPVIGLEVSYDGGRTFSSQRFSHLGTVGEYDKLIMFTRLGSARYPVFRLRFSDNAQCVLGNATLVAEIGDN